MMKVGVLDLQGAVIEHVRLLEACGCEAIRIKTIEELTDLDGLIIPGGESTTIGKLMVKYGFVEAILAKAQQGMPIYGTCAGMILLARKLVSQEQPLLSLMDITVQRNGFGRQIDSFEADLEVAGLEGKEPFKAIFIRAPYLESVDSPDVEVLAKFEEKIVMARQGNYLVSAFHPELTQDKRVHQYFLKMIKK